MSGSPVKVIIASIMSTVYETTEPGDFVPLSSLYVPLMGKLDLDLFNRIIKVIADNGHAKVTTETFALTEKGREFGRTCSEIFAEAKAS